MNCPVCQNERLVVSERSGIEIDYCPRCRGVWLDRGELDKIIERASNYHHAEPTPQPYANHAYPQHPQHGGYHHHHKHHKKESFWSELFDD